MTMDADCRLPGCPNEVTVVIIVKKPQLTVTTCSVHGGDALWVIKEQHPDYEGLSTRPYRRWINEKGDQATG